jgi:tetratricopeptide (TPR) repeat protein
VSDAGIELTREGGLHALAVAPRALARLASLERLEVALPATRSAPGDAAPLTAERARRRRGRLGSAVITVDEPRLGAALEPEALAAHGISDLRLHLAYGHVRLRARATRDGREADFTARVTVTPASRRRVRVTIDDVRVYGFLPVAAPLLGGAILAASAARGPRPPQPHWTVEIDVLDLAVYETFAGWGWRLPDISGARLTSVAVSAAGITLAWDGDADRPGVDASEITGTGTGSGPPHPIAEADGLLARGDVAGALGAYRVAARAGSAEADRRVLELLIADAATLGEATAELDRMEATTPDAPTLALAAAVIAAERGEHAVAARTYEDIATAAAARGDGDDVALARLAAAREWMRVGKTTPAPSTAATSREATAPSASTTQPVTALAVALAEAELAESSDRPQAAAAALRRAIELLPADDAGRADLARRLAAACERLGDEDGALVALLQFLDAAEAGPAVAPAWRRLVELHARRGDPQAAARALIASADDTRTGSSDEERGAALTAAAEILRKRLGLPGDAVMLLERAIALDPGSVETLDALQTTAVESSNWERLADVLERKVDAVSRGPVEQKDLLVQLAEVYDRHLQRAGRARDTHERALQLDARFQPSLTWLARDAWVRGDSAAAIALYGRLAATESDQPRPSAELRAETHVRLGTLARRAGDEGTAEREADRALAAAPAHPGALDLLIDLLEAQGRHGELGDALARRIATDLGPAARSDLARRRAHALERAGRPVEAAALWRGLVEHDAAALPALQRLADVVRATDDRETFFEVLEPLAEALVVKGDLAAADHIFAVRVQLAADPATAGALATERARLRLLTDDSGESALEVLRELPPAALPEDGLVLRAELGDRLHSLDDALPALEELRTRARAAAHGPAIEEYEARIAELVARLAAQLPRTIEELEQALASDPTDALAAEELAVFYAQIPDPRERAEALSDLLRRALGLPPDRRKAIYAVLGESAEASGDLERAEQAYWRAATIEAEPALRSNYLVSHARVLLARGEVQTAMSELEEAIARVPHHAGALALLADLTFRTQDWTRARQLYAELEVAPDAALAIARETLVHRRAVLADAQGDSADAEAFYRELAILNPRHSEARRALADIALHRGDFGAAAIRLEEVLRLLPLGSAAELIDVRQRLGAVYVQLGDWGAARYTLELVLAQDPSRQMALELLVEVYERLGLFKEAAQSCVRLARLNFDPTRRAAILHRQGEILRVHLGDEAGAFEAYLKSSDLDPRYVPTMVRLVPYFWAEGDFASLGELAADLEAASFSPDDDLELAVELALGAAFSRPARPTRWSLRGRAFDAVVAARALAQLGAAKALGDEALDTAFDTILEWAGPAPADAPLAPALAELVTQDPAATGALRVLARQADRTGNKAVARAVNALLTLADPVHTAHTADAAAAERLRALGAAPGATAEAMLLGGPAEHADAAGPLRRTLATLALPLLGLGDEPAIVAGELPAARAEALRRLAERLAAPAVVAVVEKSDLVAVRIVARAAQPVQLRVTSAAAALPEAAWTFLAARALEEARGGLCGLRGFSASERTEVLEGAQAALLGETPVGERAQAAARRVTDAVETLPAGPARERLVADLRQVLSKPADWEAFARAAAHTANRVGLLACGDPAAALEALAREDARLTGGDADSGPRRFLRTSPVRELVKFMLSSAYANAIDGQR